MAHATTVFTTTFDQSCLQSHMQDASKRPFPFGIMHSLRLERQKYGFSLKYVSIEFFRYVSVGSSHRARVK